MDTATLVGRVRAVYPRLTIRATRLITGHGQNNLVLVADDRLVFRFPRHPTGIADLPREARILRAVGPRVPLPVPDPLYVSLDEPEVGKVFVGYPMIPGQPLWRETLDAIADAPALEALGEQIGAFLRRLHAVPVADVLPDEAAAFDPLAFWRDLYAGIERRLFGHMRPDARAATARRFEAFLADPASAAFRPALVHGDFGTGNILHDPVRLAATGVIDFGHAGVGDPAVDFAALPWTPPPFFEGLTAAYPDVALAPDRVRFYRGTFALQEALFGAEEGDEAAFRAGIAPYV
ncbi:MAG TPA: aminoglycoside phosphotransferase family protein [Chloroflexota bacterium]|nr:aminoglycoside phosphotransferase family protein [Chloroflexota bacterium]